MISTRLLLNPQFHPNINLKKFKWIKDLPQKPFSLMIHQRKLKLILLNSQRILLTSTEDTKEITTDKSLQMLWKHSWELMKERLRSNNRLSVELKLFLKLNFKTKEMETNLLIKSQIQQESLETEVVFYLITEVKNLNSLLKSQISFAKKLTL